MRPIIFLAAVTSLVAAAPSIADACSPPICQVGFFTPGNDATVPANLPAIFWRPISSYAPSATDPSQVVLATAAAPSTPLPFTATQLPGGGYTIVPDQPLTPGTAYVLADRNRCGDTTITGPTVMFQVSDAAPLPASLGAPVETGNFVGPLVVPSSGGACSAEVEAHQIEIAMQLGPEAMAWRDALHFETLVDGALWRAAADRGRGVDRLYRVCKTEDPEASEGLAAGPHEVVMRATLPGSGTVVQSSSLTVVLECADDGGPADPDATGGGCDAGGGGSSGWLLLGALAAVVGLRPHRAGAIRRADA